MRAKYLFTSLICLVVLLCVSVLPVQASNNVAQSLNQQIASTQQSTVNLNPSQGKEIGFVYEAFLSPSQEPGEEENTPKVIPAYLRSTAPSVPRNQRKSRGHGMLRITKDLSKAFVDVKAEGVNSQDIIMFHIHCGNPDVLGHILVDFALTGDGNIQKNFEDGVFSVEITNENIEKTLNSGNDLLSLYTLGCPIESGKLDKVKTIAGMDQFARRNQLYFNLHTKGQTFYGDMRGQIHLVQD